MNSDLSTYPGLNDPLLPVEAGGDVLARNPVTRPETVKVSGGTISVPLPLRLWNSRALILNGFANPDVMARKLESRQIQRVNESFQPVDHNGKAWVQLYGSDYGGTTLGPFKTVFTLTQVKRANGPDVPYFMWWKYWGTSLVNKAFKEQIWGIKPNHLAVIDTAYQGKWKGVRLIEGGQHALKMVWNSSRFTDLVEIPQHLAFRTVAPRPHDDGENEVEMDAISLKLSHSDTPFFPFDSQAGDVFDPSSSSEIGKDLEEIEFQPVAWQCMLNYGGVVRF